MKKYTLEEKINVWYEVIKVNKLTMKRDVHMSYRSIFPIILVLLGLMIWSDVIIARLEMNVSNIISLVVVNVLFPLIISLSLWFIVIKVYLHKTIIAIDKYDEIKAKYWVRKYVKAGCKKYPHSYIDYSS
ncbi:Hypothetical protein, predicted transmembrane protein [Mycoplasmopsis agalactiae 14628]|uniref:Uncharacterized protein n=1 Tax=Mycoplasmopsis agalactiae 14628 TaxID=1110504 RepID=I5D5F7_MYCAA|nr:hypothetical protein [Mycoplasmopsis agalactiae]EIN14916.1 Hypothetical protein, predicted transmembrane protein [Mycoplasmopsis agalactiae 14628]